MANTSDHRERNWTDPLPWEERVTVLAVHPECARNSHIMRLAAEWMELRGDTPPPPCPDCERMREVVDIAREVGKLEWCMERGKLLCDMRAALSRLDEYPAAEGGKQ